VHPQITYSDSRAQAPFTKICDKWTSTTPCGSGFHNVCNAWKPYSRLVLTFGFLG
jgi:hypothetical protein